MGGDRDIFRIQMQFRHFRLQPWIAAPGLIAMELRYRTSFIERFRSLAAKEVSVAVQCTVYRYQMSSDGRTLHTDTYLRECRWDRRWVSNYLERHFQHGQRTSYETLSSPLATCTPTQNQTGPAPNAEGFVGHSSDRFLAPWTK